ncbi:MAG: SOS response-associated peptidase [Dissulfurispiraceae bacterium]|jgi:putative SOS response-associated peptidase YedK
MCGRFVRSSPVSTIIEIFHVASASFELSSSYNISPSQDIVIINNTGTRELVKCRWGFLPPWIKDISEVSPMINARSETIDEKPYFKEAFRKQRCLIIADGFYEWKREKKKIPYYLRLKSGKPFGLAGLYNYSSCPDGNKICGCAIITTESNDLVASIHNRMPVIVPENRIDMWLDPSFPDYNALKGILRPYASEEMEMFKISNMINSPKFDSATNILPATEE